MERVSQIIDELRKHRVFELYWDNGIEKLFEEPITLKAMFTEYQNYYKLERELALAYTGDLPLLKDSTAKITVIFSAIVPDFDIDKVFSNSSSSDNRFYIHVRFQALLDYNNLFTLDFNIADDKPGKISGREDIIAHINQKV